MVWLSGTAIYAAAAFYLVYPKIIAASGLLDPMQGPFYFFSTIGLAVELHYAALMVLADENAAKLFMFPIAMAAGVMLTGIVSLCGGGIIAITIGWSMLLTSYTFNHYIFDGKVDLVAAAFGLAATYWLLAGTGQNTSMVRLAMSGWFAGLATVAKFSYILTLGTSLSVLFVWRLGISRIPSTNFRKDVFLFAKIGIVMVLTAMIAWGLSFRLKTGP